MIRQLLRSARYVAVLALAPAVQAQVGDRYLLTVDTVHTSVQFAIETDALGECLPVASSDCPLTGRLEAELHGGVLPLASGRYCGGQVDCVPHLLGWIPNVLPSLPPLLEVDVAGLRIEPSSTTFPVLANGAFTTNDSFQVLEGLLVVRAVGLDAITLPLVGLTSDTVRTHGIVQIDPNGIRLVRQIGNSLEVDVPVLNLRVRIALRGFVEAQFHYPLPTQTCASSLNHLGTLAQLDLTGTLSISRDDLGLHCVGAVPNARSIAILGSLRANVPFGNGTLCIGGPLVRLGGLNLGVDGSGSVAVHLGNLGVLVGSTRILQVVYRDATAFNLSDALEILACP